MFDVDSIKFKYLLTKIVILIIYATERSKEYFKLRK